MYYNTVLILRMIEYTIKVYRSCSRCFLTTEETTSLWAKNPLRIDPGLDQINTIYANRIEYIAPKSSVITNVVIPSSKSFVQIF